MDCIISNNIDVSPNEYITKYSINRNFLKLINNDININDIIHQSSQRIMTYNKNKTYKAGDCVFYKIYPDSQNIYLLSSVVDGNMRKPLVMIDSAGQKVVINGDYWKIVGIPISANYIDEKPTRNPMDYALEYINTSKTDFENIHQNNTDDNHHPTGKLGYGESTKLFRNFSNIEQDRDTMHFPCRVESIPKDDTVQYGIVRKWDNGLLEYDIIYKLGYQYTNDDGKDVLCANILSVSQRDNNYLYFKNRGDYKIFAQGGDYFVTTTNTEQYNLNDDINSYTGKINFPIEFKNRNYTVFTSNVKNIETESYAANDIVIKDYDNRLIINGSNLVGYVEDSSFRYPLYIPNDVKTISEGALADIVQTEWYELQIEIDKNSNLNIIDRYAFQNSAIKHITIGKNVRYIADYAFDNCSQLSSIDFYLKNDQEKQVKIDFLAFNNTNIEQINIYYEGNGPLLGVTEEQRDRIYSSTTSLENKFKDKIWTHAIGIDTNPQINVYYENNSTFATRSFVPEYTFPEIKEENLLKTSILFGSNGSDEDQREKYQGYYLSDILVCNESTITGYNDVLSSPIHIDLEDLPQNIIKIGDQALSAFRNISSITIPERFTDVGASAMYQCGNLRDISIDMYGTFIYQDAFNCCNIDNFIVKNILSSKYAVSNTTYISGFGINSLLGAIINKIEFESIKTFNQISGFFIKKELGKDNIPYIGSETVIQMEDEYRIVRQKYNSQSKTIVTTYETVPWYLTIDGNSVIGCDYNIISSESIRTIHIPYGIQKIDTKSLSPIFNGVSYNNLSGICVSKINIPQTVNYIGDYAMCELCTLNEINIEAGTSFQYLGLNMISGCINLREFVVSNPVNN